MTTYLIWDNSAGDTEVLAFDVCTEETHDLGAEITEFPVELAPGMSDQIVLKPATCSLIGYVGDKPLQTNDESMRLETRSLNLPAAPAYVQTTVTLDVPSGPQKLNVNALLTSAFNAAFGDSPTAQVRKRQGDREDKQDVKVWVGGDKSRTQAAWNLLKKARDERAEIRVLSDYDDTSGYRIEDLQMHRAAEDGLGATFTLQLKTITIATTETVAAPRPAETLGQAKKSTGSKPGEPAKEEPKVRSILKAIISESLG